MFSIFIYGPLHTAAWAMGLYTLQQPLHIIHLLVTVWANCWTSCISLSAVSFSHFQRRNKVANCKSSHYCTSSQGHHPSTFPQFQNASCQRHESSSTRPASFFFFYSTSRHSPRHAVGGALRVESACHPRRGTGRCRRRGRLALGLQPSAAPASAGWGSGDPPAPAVSVFVYVSFFPSCSLLLCRTVEPCV